MDVIIESGSEDLDEKRSRTFSEDEEYDSYPTNVRSVSCYRRSWPQNSKESTERLGINNRRKGQQQNPYAGNRLYEETQQRYNLPKQVIDWEQLPEEKIAGLDKSTVWNGGSGLFNIDTDATELGNIAALFGETWSNTNRNAKMTKDSVLSTKRATTISMTLRRLSLRPPRLAKVGLALRTLNEAYLDESVVDLMLKSSIWATNEELALIKSRVYAGQVLADPDALLWFMAVTVPDCESRLLTMGIRYEFDDWLNNTIRAMSIIKSACMEVCTSELMKQLMQVSLLVGNSINEAHGGVIAKAFSISSLSKLSKVKSTDKSRSVLDCIVEYLDKTAPEVFGVVDDCTCVAEAAKYSLSEQTLIARNVRVSLERIRVFPEMREFYITAVKKMMEMERELQKATEAFEKAKRSFGLTSKDSLDTDVFFGMISDFFICLDNAVLAHETREKVRESTANGVLPQDRELPKQKKSVASTRLSIFGRLGSSAGSEILRRSFISTPRQSIFGRMKPIKDKV